MGNKIKRIFDKGGFLKTERRKRALGIIEGHLKKLKERKSQGIEIAETLFSKGTIDKPFLDWTQKFLNDPRAGEIVRVMWEQERDRVKNRIEQAERNRNMSKSLKPLKIK